MRVTPRRTALLLALLASAGGLVWWLLSSTRLPGGASEDAAADEAASAAAVARARPATPTSATGVGASAGAPATALTRGAVLDAVARGRVAAAPGGPERHGGTRAGDATSAAGDDPSATAMHEIVHDASELAHECLEIGARGGERRDGHMTIELTLGVDADGTGEVASVAYTDAKPLPGDAIRACITEAFDAYHFPASFVHGRTVIPFTVASISDDSAP